MNKKKELAKNTFIISIGKICTQLITFLLLPLYTSVLSTSDYGIVDLINTIVILLVPIITLQLEQGLFRELIEVRDDNIKKKSIISSGINCMLIQFIIYLILFFSISIFINNDYKLFLVTNVISYILNSILLQIARGCGNNKVYSIGSFLCAFSTILFNILFLVVIKLGVYGMIIGTMLGQLISAVYIFISMKLYNFYSIKKFDKDIIKKIILYTIPLVPNAISWWVFNASDKLIVSIFLGMSFTGILSASLKFSNVISATYNVFHISWIESMALHIKDKDISVFFNETFDIILSFFTSVIVMVIACMPIIFPILINKNFSFSYYLIPISLVAAIFHIIVSLVTAIYYGYKDSKAIAQTSIFSAIINIIAHLILIKFVGLYAAPISTLIAYLSMGIYRVIVINKKYFKINFDLKKVLLTFITLILVCTLYYLNNMFMNLVSIIIALLYSWTMNRKTFNKLVLIIKNKLSSK